MNPGWSGWWVGLVELNVWLLSQTNLESFSYCNHTPPSSASRNQRSCHQRTQQLSMTRPHQLMIHTWDSPENACCCSWCCEHFYQIINSLIINSCKDVKTFCIMILIECKPNSSLSLKFPRSCNIYSLKLFPEQKCNFQVGIHSSHAPETIQSLYIFTQPMLSLSQGLPNKMISWIQSSSKTLNCLKN